MKVILSIKPEFVNKIIKGEKEFEFRRKLFTKEVESVMVYASSPIKKIVGEFTISEILRLDLNMLWKKTKDKAGISQMFFYEYFKGLKKGYAIKIKKFYSYKKTLNLEELGILTSPQSFIYYYDTRDKFFLKSNNFQKIRVVNPQLYNTLYGLTEEEIRIIENK